MSDDLLKRGHKLGRYEVREMIGQGGMGQVYRAWDEILGRDVAVKVLTVPDEDMLKRFAREAAAIGRLENPHVIEIHDLSTAGPHPHIVMEYLRGESLHARLQRGPMEIEDAVEVILGVCCGVNACHRVGIVHRDIKPANVYLSQTIEYGVVVKVLDFGVAKPVQIARRDEVTGPGIVVGTPRYLAPENLRGEDADQLSDQYQIGLLLYVCLTGRPPFAEEKEEKALIQAILKAEYPTLREQRVDVPAELEQVVFRAMSADRTMRFSSVLELARALVSHAGAQNRTLWRQVFDGGDHAPTAGKMADVTGTVTKVKSPVIGLDTTRVLRGDQVVMLAKKSAMTEPTVALAKNLEEQPAPQGPTLRFAPAPTAKLDPSQVPPQTSTRVLPTHGEPVFAPPRVRMAVEVPRTTKKLPHGILASLLVVAGMGVLGTLLLTRDRREAPAPKVSKVYLPIPAADAGTRVPDVTDRDEGDLGTKAQPPVEAIPPSHDGIEDRSKRARAQDFDRKRRPRKSRGVDYTREGSPILD